MPTLMIRFPAGRYHATPWGHHVNEGMIEWPPSPWRLLRSLISIGYTSGLWHGDGPPPPARLLVEKLAGILPVYRLPTGAGAHSRHYMPEGGLDRNKLQKRKLYFDTWAKVDGRQVMSITWDVSLAPEEYRLLSELTARLGYLGRSESWTEIGLLPPDAAKPEPPDCFPSDDPPPPGWEQVPLLTPLSRDQYEQWRDRGTKAALDRLASSIAPGKKPTARQREKALAPYPADLIECLQADIGWLRGQGWHQPPGSRRVLYTRRADALESGTPRPHVTRLAARPVPAMLLALSTSSGTLRALPPVTRTLPQAELFHRALTHFATLEEGHCPVLTGCDAEGNPLKGPHDHAHVLPLDLDGDGHLDHVLVWAPAGLDGFAQQAVRAVRRTYAKDMPDPLRVALAGAGSSADMRRLPEPLGGRLEGIFGPEGGARRWISLTPFVTPRYIKRYGRNTLNGQVAAELASRGLPMPAEVRKFAPDANPLVSRHRHFVRKRRSGPQPPVDFGYSLEIRFSDPVLGPLCLGYGGHFGLGVFIAEI